MGVVLIILCAYLLCAVSQLTDLSSLKLSGSHLVLLVTPLTYLLTHFLWYISFSRIYVLTISLLLSQAAVSSHFATQDRWCPSHVGSLESQGLVVSETSSEEWEEGIQSHGQWRTSERGWAGDSPGVELSLASLEGGTEVCASVYMHWCASGSGSWGLVGVLRMSPDFSQVSLVMLQVTKLAHFCISVFAEREKHTE